jgi:hypothetical protein
MSQCSSSTGIGRMASGRAGVRVELRLLVHPLPIPGAAACPRCRGTPLAQGVAVTVAGVCPVCWQRYGRAVTLEAPCAL